MASAPKAPEELVRRWMRRWKVPGTSLAVVERGKPLFSRGYGFRDREAKLPATPRTVFGLASVTKSFTAMAILRLEEDRKLSTRDPIVRHLPDFGTPDPRATRKIRIHHFLTHTSGLPPLPSIYYTSARSLAGDPPYDPRVARRVGIDPDHAPIDSYGDMMQFLRKTPYRLLGPPGQCYSYSNEAFGLLGAVIEQASGRTYESFLEEEVLRPAGMRSTTFDSGVMFRYPEVTTLYSAKTTGKRHGLVPSQKWWDDTCLRAAGGLRSNVEDLARYVQIYLNDGRVDGERVLTAASVRKMTRPYVEIEAGVHYGYGVSVRPDYHGTPIISHSGGLKGVSSFFAVLPRRHLAGVVLNNAEGVSAPLPLMAALNARLGLPLATPLSVTPRPTTAEHSLREYEGWYCSGEGIWVRSTALKGRLRFDFRGIEVTARGLRLRPAGQDRFVVRVGGADGQVRFLRDPRGRIWALFLGWRLLRRRSARELPRARSGSLVW